MPSAMASTLSVNSSRDLVAAMRSSTAGMTRWPTTAARKTSPTILTTVRPIPVAIVVHVTIPVASVGSRTRTMTVRTSSATSQPTAMWPIGVCSCLASASTRTSTTVLATDSANPNTIAPFSGQPVTRAMVAPSTAATVMPARAPGMATRRTASSSSR
jgi:hypothetical protein